MHVGLMPNLPVPLGNGAGIVGFGAHIGSERCTSPVWQLPVPPGMSASLDVDDDE